MVDIVYPLHFFFFFKGKKWRFLFCCSGRIALTLGYCKPTNFTYKITFADTGEEMYQGQKLKNFALQHHGQNQTGTFVFRAPRPGQYYFTIFAQLLTGELGVKNIFTASCEYKVRFQRGQELSGVGDVVECHHGSGWGIASISSLILTPSLPQSVKFLGWKVLKHACREGIFRSYNKSVFDTVCLLKQILSCAEKRRRKKA